MVAVTKRIPVSAGSLRQQRQAWEGSGRGRIMEQGLGRRELKQEAHTIYMVIHNLITFT